MILIFFMCFKLSILHLCVSDSDLGYQCSSSDDWLHPYTSNDKPDIFLISDYSSRDKGYYSHVLRKIFKHACIPFYNIKSGSIEKANKMNQSNIIHFGVLDYNDAQLPKNFEYAGNVTKTMDVVCNKTNKPDYFDCHEIANLVSSSIKTVNHGHIYNYVQKIDMPTAEYRDTDNCAPFVQVQTINLTTVVLCMDAPIRIKVNIKSLKLILTDTDACLGYLPEISDRYLAVLVPKPFEVFTEYLVPTIFYETPYIFSENQTAFPNSMNVVPWQLLKYGFLKFIQTVGWQRVLIVTDDSEYSLEFENELIALFNKDRMVYTVIRCEDANCEMDKVKQELRRISAKIVIANVEAEHAQYLIHNNPKITWILRDMAENTPYIPYGHVGHVFSISLRTVHDPEGCTDLDDNILTGLNSIGLAYKSLVKEDFDVKKREFYRLFAKKAKQITARKTEAIVVVHAGDGKEISTMYVDDNGAKLLTFKNPFESGKPSDGTTLCFTTSYDYFKPCQDRLVILLMFIILIFFLTFILITCYFHKTSPLNDIRYWRF